MAIISEKKIAEIVEKADIVTIISSYLTLQKKGRNYWGVCPFHQDGNPSMSVSPEKKIFSCFSCHVGGTVIEFVKKFEKINFPSALKKVAEITGIEINELKNYAIKEKYSDDEKMIFKLNEEANNFYRTLMFSQLGKTAHEYLSSRNILNDQISSFEIGYSSRQASLCERLLEKGYSKQQISDAGLGTVYDLEIKDYFVNRIIFPIKNEDNYIIGFSARALNDEKPKYINSRENLIFKKSQLAYNIQNVLRMHMENNQVIVLEGFMDVISLESIGIKNAIAIMGTALSEYHIKLFKSNKMEVKLFLDGDLAGINATIKAAKALMRANIKTTIVDNNTNQDPDELIQDGQKDFVISRIEDSTHPAIFLVKKMWENVDNNNPDSISQYLTKIGDFIDGIKDPVIIDKTILLLMKLTKLTQSTIIQMLRIQSTVSSNKVNGNSKKIFVDKQENTIKNSKPLAREVDPIIKKAYEIAEQKVFVSLLKSSQYLDKIAQNIELIINNNIRSAMRGIISEYRCGNYHGGNPEQALKLIEDRIVDYRNQIELILANKIIMLDASEKEIDDAFIMLNQYQSYLAVHRAEIELKNATSSEEKMLIMQRLDILRKMANKMKR
ncbi:DNA primase [Mesoplasma syrphidae]|uniref:DNA primase n=1 Tax=Mesoplasma syrphidae TaxID=225999 RepID=A0A2K9BK50_9MOLU|nr:DNA primase [Mesoplasma syrphidae]AUF83616.1 DNA primase [Mesoplasma syrphidae]